MFISGLERTLRRHTPVVYLEYDHRFKKRVPFERLPRTYLRGLGYSCVPNDNSKSRREVIDGLGEVELGCVGGYCDLICSADVSRNDTLRFLGKWRSTSSSSTRAKTRTGSVDSQLSLLTP